MLRLLALPLGSFQARATVQELQSPSPRPSPRKSSRPSPRGSPRHTSHAETSLPSTPPPSMTAASSSARTPTSAASMQAALLGTSRWLSEETVDDDAHLSQNQTPLLGTSVTNGTPKSTPSRKVSFDPPAASMPSAAKALFVGDAKGAAPGPCSSESFMHRRLNHSLKR